MLETVRGRHLRGAYAKKGVDVLAEGGGKVRIRRRQDVVLVNLTKSGLPLATVLKKQN